MSIKLKCNQLKNVIFFGLDLITLSFIVHPLLRSTAAGASHTLHTQRTNTVTLSL